MLAEKDLDLILPKNVGTLQVEGQRITSRVPSSTERRGRSHFAGQRLAALNVAVVEASLPLPVRRRHPPR